MDKKLKLEKYQVEAIVKASGERPANKPERKGVKVRGTGAATRGITARGPMA